MLLLLCYFLSRASQQLPAAWIHTVTTYYHGMMPFTGRHAGIICSLQRHLNDTDQ